MRGSPLEATPMVEVLKVTLSMSTFPPEVLKATLAGLDRAPKPNQVLKLDSGH